MKKDKLYHVIAGFLIGLIFGLIKPVAGIILAVGAGKVIQFFRFCVDYTRTERVQFEDDEYYYYVKAYATKNKKQYYSDNSAKKSVKI